MATDSRPRPAAAGPETASLPALITVSECAAWLRVPQQIVRALIGRGDLPAFSIGLDAATASPDQLRIVETDLLAWTANRITATLTADTDPRPAFMTIAAAATLFRRNRTTIAEWLDSGRLNAIHTGPQHGARRVAIDAVFGRQLALQRGVPTSVAEITQDGSDTGRSPGA